MTAASNWPSLDPSIQVLPDTDVADVWDRFEVFEALHHTMAICNPMSSAQLDQAIDAFGLKHGSSVLDAACGYGELLIRAAEATDIHGVGIDLSPWMMQTALAHANHRVPEASLRWVLGEARDFVPAESLDVAVCSGAEWVWHDLAGTIRALGQRLSDGGVAAVGGARLHHGADPAAILRSHGRIDTVDDVEAMLATNGFSLRTRIDPDDAAWDSYLDRTAVASRQWQVLRPGPRSQQWVQEQRDWQSARDRDRGIIGWSFWIAEKRR